VKLNFDFPPPLRLGADRLPRTGRPVGELHSALLKVKLPVSASDLARKEVGESTAEAVRAFQERADLDASGELDDPTLQRLNAEVAHAFVAESRTRTRRLQHLLRQAGQVLDPREEGARTLGPTTQRAIDVMQQRFGLPTDGRISLAFVDKLREDALASQLKAKGQVAQVQQTLLRALDIAKLPEVRVDAVELKRRTFGPSTQAALQVIQQKYGLAATGQLDAATWDRIVSIAKSIPESVRHVRPMAASDLRTVPRSSRLNMRGAHVAHVQRSLAFLDHKIAASEFKEQRFGKSTRQALIAFEQSHGLPVTGHAAGDTLRVLNKEIRKVNPAAAGELSRRLRGSVRNDTWRGVAGVTVQIREKLVNGQGALLAERKTGSGGFYDVPYQPPLDPTTKQVKRPYHLEVKSIDGAGHELGTKQLFNPAPIAWVNFTQGDQPYRGTSEFEARSSAVRRAIGATDIGALTETDADRQITRAAQASALVDEDVMRLVLAYRLAAKLARPAVTPAACYAYIGQNLPPSLPSSLVNSTEDWTLIDELIEMTANGIVFMDEDVKALAWDNAVTSNLMPIAVGRQKAAVLSELASLKQSYVLDKPILVGSGSVRGLLTASAVPEANYDAVALTFLKHKSFGPAFWQDLESRPAEFGGAAAVNDLRTTVEVGHVANNFPPMAAVIKAKIDDPGDQMNAARDAAKLTVDDWSALIDQNGGLVPPNTDGQTAADKVKTYATMLASRSELMFPSVALVASVVRSVATPLTNAHAVQTLMDAHPELDLRGVSVDVFVQKNAIAIDDATLTDTRVLQRVARIAPTAAAGQVLLENKLHNSAQIVAMGEDRFLATMTGGQKLDVRTSKTMYAHAEFQYAQVLQRITDYRFDLHRADPKAIADHTYTTAELPPELSAIPNLETLFGSLDFCACDHCQSVYGPAAYLADLLRYLDHHDSEEDDAAHVGRKRTVRALLFDRRPDLGNVKLNCENTETPLPYVDLVCEVLENAVAAPNPNPAFAFQTTLTAAELRAAPERVRDETYEVLRTADFPMHAAFDLWQTQARAFLEHLGVPRWELMEAYQARSQGPAVPGDASIAAESWGISTHEATIVTAASDNTEAKQKTYWGIAAAALPTSMTVAEFLRRSFLQYDQLLALLQARWINPDGGANNVVIDRPDGTCDTELQTVVNLTVDRMDRIHRFLRLWRRTGWSIWELDALIRAPKIGGGTLDSAFLGRLRIFGRLQHRLGLPVDRLLVLFQDISNEAWLRTDDSQRRLPSLYERLFQDTTVLRPLDQAFSLPIAANTVIADSDPATDHRRTVLAAFSLGAADLERVLAKLPDNALNLSNLSVVARVVWLAKGLGVSVKELAEMRTEWHVADVYSSPATLWDFVDAVDWIRRTSFTLDELHYALGADLASPLGLRDEVISRHLDTLRRAIVSDSKRDTDGVIAAQVSTALALPSDAAMPLLLAGKVGLVSWLEVLKDPQLVARAADGTFTNAVDRPTFANAFAAIGMLHKTALVVTRFALDARDVKWLLVHGPACGLLTLERLPITQPPALPPPAQPLLAPWLALAKWIHVKSLFPEPEDASLRNIFELATVAVTPLADIQTAISKLTQWEKSEVEAITIALALSHGVISDFAVPENYLRMDRCRRMARRLGVSPGKAVEWATRDVDAAQKLTAQETRQTAKSKYDEIAWREKVSPIEDTIREKKRDALIAHLVARSIVSATAKITQGGRTFANPVYWRDGDDLLKYFLIDVQMGSCQLTSRIKQAISSVQMFVQRCLLGLEQPRIEVSRSAQQNGSAAESWKQWKWMKNYRVWEANRKVFLYPENWIEPELRDDKSPFFEDLEQELLQSDMTDENAAQAFIHYVEKVHEVARLDVVGAYHELDDTDPSDGLPPDINVFHVIGRTRAHPPVYFSRRFDLNDGEWSPWEKIDLDIASEQVVPVVYNRQLFLFWLLFVEKPQKVRKLPPAKATEGVANTPEPPNQLEVQLCWSMQKKDGWTNRKISKQKLIHPWQRPTNSYNLKPRYKSRENLLWLDVYISQSKEFNSTEFWDPYANKRAYVTARHPFDENSRPWHSSSFVFDGDVLDVKMKPLAGQYHVLGADGVAQEDVSAVDSLRYVHDGSEAGRSIKALSGVYEIAPRLPLPDGMHYSGTRLANNKTLANPDRVNVLENGHSRTLLGAAKSPFEIVASQHSIAFDTATWGPVPFFYQDTVRAFFVRPEWQQVLVGYNKTLQTYNYNFFPFYHPYTALFLREIKRSGLEGLLNRPIQVSPQSYYPGNGFDFATYGSQSGSLPDKTAKNDRVDFERYGAYSLYNWEIFFHAPLLVACRLSQNQRFEEAMQWFHYIFDPTETHSPDVPQRYWVTRPFYEQNSDAYRKQRIENLLANIEQHTDELRAWKNNPFKPHLVARYRPIAYQKSVVMKYIDNLIAWGDQLFRRDTIESINEATTLYTLAHELLGRRPVKVPKVAHDDKSYNELVADGGLDPFGNRKVDVLMENFTPTPTRVTRAASDAEPLPTLNVFYFAIPDNDRLLTYWDKVEDRLFKIRHCMNFEGVVRQLALFEPPIDPALLVKAAAAGVDLGTVLSNLAVEPSPYRFRTLSQKALEICAEARTLGDKLLSVLEKRDAEGLALLRSTHEVATLKAVREVRKQQIGEANENWAALEKSLEMAQKRHDYFNDRQFMNDLETVSAVLSGASMVVTGGLAVGEFLASGFHLAPSFNIGASGFGGSPHFTVSWGSENIARSIAASTAGVGHIGNLLSQGASLVGTIGSYHRRQDEWSYQADLADSEIAQINRQIVAAQIRLAIAEKELDNQELQIVQSEAVDEYMRSKYTDQRLYDWHLRQISTVYFQCYQLAYETARRAEKCFQFERGDAVASFIGFGYWDSLKKGLQAGEQLTNDIRRMEVAYLGQNTRELEITKHVSLAQVHPLGLLALKQAGSCSITLPEWLFDMDFPGHYFRRIKSVAVSIPCVTGPYTSVNCTLSLTNHGIRISKDVAGGYGDPLVAGDVRFVKSVVPQTAISTSHGQNDAGMFELSFNDERYLPFEGAGAASSWTLSLPSETNRFDVSTVSDVILHVRYTARAGGDVNLDTAARNNLATVLPAKGSRLFRLDQEFADEWYRFLHPEAGDQVLHLSIGRQHLPFHLRGKPNVTLTQVDIFADGAAKADGIAIDYDVDLLPPSGVSANGLDFKVDPVYGQTRHLIQAGFGNADSVIGEWQLRIRRSGATDSHSLPADDLRHPYLLVNFSTS
jgi:peptidoglycan hydrolase-like protein with peptidoglycan-binding domain